MQAGVARQTETNVVAEIAFRSGEVYANPFTDVALAVVFTDPGGTEKAVPAFWAGGTDWKVMAKARVHK